MDPQAEALSPGDGGFAVKDLPPGRYVVRVTAAGLRRGVPTRRARHRGRAQRQRARGARPGRGVVRRWWRDEDGARRARARGSWPWRCRASACSGWTAWTCSRDAEGAYRLDTLVPGVRYFVEAWAEGHAPTGRVAVAEGIRQHDVARSKAGPRGGPRHRPGHGRRRPRRAGDAARRPGRDALARVGRDGRRRPYVLPHVSPGPAAALVGEGRGLRARGDGRGGLGGRRVVGGRDHGARRRARRRAGRWAGA